MAGRSACAVFPTGSGKSLCYQLPSILLEGLTLVVSPLIALMKDQIDALEARGIPAVRLDSSLSREEFQTALEGIRSGRIRLLYSAPERFNNERFRDFVKQQRISLFAVDEAHCISEWGHNFRPDYLKLAEFAREAGAERILALTATATPEVIHEMCEHFRIDPSCAIRTGFYRPNLHLRARVVRAEVRERELVDELSRAPAGPKIVYVTVQKAAVQVASRLADQGYDARPYHAGLDADLRHQTQEWFSDSSDGIVVATIAFGMGIDKSNIRGVYHFNSAKSIENYSQEIGRAGRDDEIAHCVTLLAPEDRVSLENFAYGDTPGLTSVQRLVEWIFDQPREFELNSFQLSAETDIRSLVLKTMLVYLELDGYLQGGTPLYTEYKFVPLRPSSEILADLPEGDERIFAKRVLAQSEKARKWFKIDVAATSEKLQVPREQVIRILDQLGEKGDLDLQASGIRQRYRIARPPEDPVELAHDLYERSLQREEREIERLSELQALLLYSECMSGALASYFGEELGKPCGHCSACVGEDRGELPPVESAGEVEWPDLSGLIEEHPKALADPRAQARFLCGLTSPATTGAKLTRHALFGVLAHHSFVDILEALER